METLTQAQEILGVIAQLALAIIGFSGIVAVLGQRNDGSWTASDLGRMGIMLMAGFRALFAALLPFAFLYFDLSENIVWAASSGIVGVTTVVILFFLVRQVAPTVVADSHHKPWFQRAAIVLSICSAVINLLNAAGVYFQQTFAPYLLSLLLTLAIACMYFVRLIQTAMSKVVVQAGSDDQ
jgi:hypothetical protein